MTPSEMLAVAAILSPIVIGFGGWLIRVEIRLNHQQQKSDDASHQLEIIGQKMDRIESGQSQLNIAMARIEERIKTLFEKEK